MMVVCDKDFQQKDLERVLLLNATQIKSRYTQIFAMYSFQSATDLCLKQQFQ